MRWISFLPDYDKAKRNEQLLQSVFICMFQCLTTESILINEVSVIGKSISQKHTLLPRKRNIPEQLLDIYLLASTQYLNKASRLTFFLIQLKWNIISIHRERDGEQWNKRHRTVRNKIQSHKDVQGVTFIRWNLLFSWLNIG